MYNNEPTKPKIGFQKKLKKIKQKPCKISKVAGYQINIQKYIVCL